MNYPISKYESIGWKACEILTEKLTIELKRFDAFCFKPQRGEIIIAKANEKMSPEGAA